MPPQAATTQRPVPEMVSCCQRASRQFSIAAPPPRRRGRPRNQPDIAPPPTCPSSLDLSNEDLFCTCRRPDDGNLMVQCDHCDEWFHGLCVGVTSEEASTLEQVVCPNTLGGLLIVSFYFTGITTATMMVPPPAPLRGHHHITRKTEPRWLAP